MKNLNITLGYTESNGEIFLKTFSPKKDPQEIESHLSEIESELPDILFYSRKGYEESDQLEKLSEDANNRFPLIDADSFNLTQASFKGMNYNEAASIKSKCETTWYLLSNLQYVEGYYKTIQLFKRLWQENRNQFFKELWQFIRSNIPAEEIRLVFHDVEKQEGSKKVKLIPRSIAGKFAPADQESEEADEKILKDVHQQSSLPFLVREFNPEKQQIVFACNIEKSPVVVMLKAKSLTPLQKSILTGFFSAFA